MLKTALEAPVIPCRLDPEMWVGDHEPQRGKLPSGHAACDHRIAKHMCNYHCPLLEACGTVADANPEWFTNTVIAGRWMDGSSDPMIRRVNDRLVLEVRECEFCVGD